MTTSRPQKTALLVAQRIVADINAQGKTAGDRLPPERVMLDEYEVGRGTLRESLRYLELQGVIKLRPGPNGGPIVQQPDGSGLADSLSLLLQSRQAPFQNIIEARDALEPAMARLAAERMTDDEIEELGRIVEAERAAVKDQPTFLQQTRAFHNAIARGSDNALFSLLFLALTDILDGTTVGIEYPLKLRKATVDHHTALHAALAARDAETAEKLMEEQMEALTRYTGKRYASALSRPVIWAG